MCPSKQKHGGKAWLTSLSALVHCIQEEYWILLLLLFVCLIVDMLPFKHLILGFLVIKTQVAKRSELNILLELTAKGGVGGLTVVADMIAF